MSTPNLIEINVAPQNPAQFLACCGIAEIVSRFDPEMVSSWALAPSPSLRIESVIDEASSLSCIARALGNEECWRLKPEPGDAGGRIDRVDVIFTLDGLDRVIPLDWWYETLTEDFQIGEKSAWKMYAGQQTVSGINTDMMRCAKGIYTQFAPASFTELLKLNLGMKGRFGFDPRSSRNALDSGFSANDLNLPVPTYPFVELLATIGAQTFFAHRTQTIAGISSTRGWSESTAFRYALWFAPLPISLARMAASCADVLDARKLLPLRSARASRDKYSNLTIAVRTTLKRGEQ